jgi:subtilisin family serine protease
VPDSPMLVLDTVHEDGAKLVELDDDVARSITESSAPLRAVPVVTYALPDSFSQLEAAIRAADLASLLPSTVTLTCRDARSGAGLADCKVVAFTDFASRVGASGVTDAQGQLTLTLNAAQVERLYVMSAPSHWGAFRSAVPIANGQAILIDIEPIDLGFADAVRLLYGASRYDPASPVTVGVIDTGLGPHPQLNIVSLQNTVSGEPRSAGEDWFGHGTHVGGLIGARGAAGGLRGMAPGVPLRGYRVFGKDAKGATNYAILKAMIHAVDDGCDIINLSLGGGPKDVIVEEAVRDARTQGTLVVVAAGNDGRQPVSYPAAYSGATAVSAMGVTRGFPPGSLSEGDILHPPQSAQYPDEFIAGFSNVGHEISLATPGVGLLSTLPGGGYGPMSGTSMAAPVAAGAAACRLSQAPDVQALPPGSSRSDRIEKLLLTSCQPRGFPADFVGYGIPDPALV